MMLLVSESGWSSQSVDRSRILLSSRATLDSCHWISQSWKLLDCSSQESSILDDVTDQQNKTPGTRGIQLRYQYSEASVLCGNPELKTARTVVKIWNAQHSETNLRLSSDQTSNFKFCPIMATGEYKLLHSLVPLSSWGELFLWAWSPSTLSFVFFTLLIHLNLLLRLEVLCPKQGSESVQPSKRS